ncbi:hypothetical protein [Virgisporangium aurantiacum]|uniref:Uncharacterized protein n=1 Tax=Virgisporangium aurantiacum TaxID=175570 RepID=A0A8J3Z4Q6_9ACTN|nr:hypothetical protein [Virgisporangium aurantiacum]GIJ54998.1 hypothetical protein Vau01_025140 [Virgisporangium aurantiacum]
MALEKRLREVGGYYAGSVVLQISLQAVGNVPIRVSDVRLSNIKREPPINHTLVAYPTGADEKTFKMTFDLDEPVPVAKEYSDTGGAGQPFFQNRTLTLNQSDDDVLLLAISVEKWSVSFGVSIDYVVNGQRGVVEVKDEGRPFRVTGYNCPRPGQTYTPYQQIWDALPGTDNGKLGPIDDHEAYRSLCNR